MKVIVFCLIIDVLIVSGWFCCCFVSIYEVDYCNIGMVLVIDVYIDLMLDFFLIIDFVDLVYIFIEEKVYCF